MIEVPIMCSPDSGDGAEPDIEDGEEERETGVEKEDKGAEKGVRGEEREAAEGNADGKAAI
jgi:hypothetical protein